MPKRGRSAGGQRPKRRRTTRTLYRKKSAFARRKSFSKKRAPVTECKKKEIPPAAALATVCNEPTRTVNYQTMSNIEDFTYVPTTWLSMKRGFNESEMVGRDIFLKWLHVKHRLSWSNVQNQQWKYRVRVRVMHGWIMLPGCVPDGTPGSPEYKTDYLQEVKNVLKVEMSKVLAGPDKTKVRILSDRMVTRGGSFSAIDSGGTVIVPRRSHDIHFKWSPMRKIRYDQAVYGEPATFRPEPSVGQWIPFYALWDQSASEAPDGDSGTPPKQTIYDMAQKYTREEMYFTDS